MSCQLQMKTCSEIYKKTDSQIDQKLFMLFERTNRENRKGRQSREMLSATVERV